MSYQLGLKIWSHNVGYKNDAVRLYNESFFKYIEIFALPGSAKDYGSYWKGLNIPYIVHAPHFVQGLNFSKKELFLSNMQMVNDTQRFADILNASKIIFHPGIGGSYEESARQIKSINDSRIIIENKPYKIIVPKSNPVSYRICVGYSPEQIEYIVKTAKVGFCLDIGHAICAANGLGMEKFQFLEEFINLSPEMFHISDGEANGFIDKHYNIGNGSYDFEKIFSYLPDNSMITLETEKSSFDNLDDFVIDVLKIKQYF